MPDEHEPAPDEPLGYRNPADDRRPGGTPALAFLGGAVLGVAAPAVAGFVLALSAAGGSTVARRVIGAGFGLVAAAAVVGGVRSLRPADRRWFAGGFMLALGVVAAVEGLCFTAILSNL